MYTFIHLFVGSPAYNFNVYTVVHLVNFLIAPFKSFYSFIYFWCHMLQKEPQGFFISPYHEEVSHLWSIL